MTAALPDGYTARPARADDATAILDVIRACDLAETGEVDDWTEQDMLDGWRGRGLGTFVTQELEARAERMVVEHPAGVQVLLSTGITRGNEGAMRLLEAE